jgi:putative membrane protein
MAGLALLLEGTVGGQGMNPGQNPQGQYPQPTNPAMQNQPIPTMSVVNDQDFLKDAAEGGLAEIKLGQLAEDKGSSDVVKSFGKRMVEDHSKANDQLNDVALHEKVKLPTELSKKNQKAYDRLSELSGDAFDRAYARAMVRDHQNDMDAFRQEAGSGQVEAIKSFASQTLPTLQEHLKMAREMEQAVGKPTGKSGGQ